MKLKSKCHNLHEMKTRHKRQYVNNTASPSPLPYSSHLTPLPPYQCHGSASLRLISRPRPASASALQTNHIIMIERSQRRRRRQLFCSFALHLRLITLLPLPPSASPSPCCCLCYLRRSFGAFFMARAYKNKSVRLTAAVIECKCPSKNT